MSVMSGNFLLVRDPTFCKEKNNKVIK